MASADTMEEMSVVAHFDPMEPPPLDRLSETEPMATSVAPIGGYAEPTIEKAPVEPPTGERFTGSMLLPRVCYASHSWAIEETMVEVKTSRLSAQRTCFHATYVATFR